MSSLPLEGVRVLEPAVLLAAPFATSLMGDFGAEVIKCELPGVGDPLRHMGPMRDGTSLWWKATSRNKKSITVDLRQPRGQELFKRLATHADVVLESFRPGVMEGWGVGWEDLRKVNPRLIMCRQSGFGQDGPYASRPGYGNVSESYAGLAIRTAYSDTPPAGTGMGDYIAGLHIVHAIMFALYHRDVHGGPGQVIDNAAVQAVLRQSGEYAVTAAQFGMEAMPRGVSNPSSWGESLRGGGYFRTRDGKWCLLHSGTPGTAFWANFMKALGHEEYLDEDSYPPGSEARRMRSAEIHQTVQEWFDNRDRDDATTEAVKIGVTIAPLYTTAEMMKDPHLQAREAFVEVEDPDLGPLKMVTPTPRFSETPGRVRHTGPRLGEHNNEVYGSLLGLSSGELEELQKGKVI